jgi:hypothetical protein
MNAPFGRLQGVAGPYASATFGPPEQVVEKIPKHNA